jgi:hypothetical protein
MNSSLAERGAGAAAAEGDSWMVALRSEIARVRGHAAAAAPRDDAALASVVVLNFNGGDVIGRCLDHLGAQTYRRREVIVVDNGSTDGSAALLGERARRGEIRLLGSARNLGVAGGRNLAVRHASGRIVAFLDADAYARRPGSNGWWRGSSPTTPSAPPPRWSSSTATSSSSTAPAEH